MRRCNKCGVEKPLDEFYQNKESKGGRRATCISCVKQVSKKYRITHHEELREEKKSWYQANKEKVIAKNYQRRAEKPWQRIEWDKKFRIVHAESERVRHEKYAREHPEQNRLKAIRRYAKKKAVGGNVTVNEWMEILERYGHRCLGCGATDVKLEMDHVVPIKLGGRHSPENIQPLCRSCNAKKSAHIIDYRPGQGKIF